MYRPSRFLASSFLVCLLCCGRTSLDIKIVGAGGTLLLGGLPTTGGVSAAGGVTGTGGAKSGSGGMADGGGAGIAGSSGVGGAITASGGSVSTGDLDACSSDADCLLSCIWVTAPTNSSQCTAFYCCGMTWLSKRRCDVNQAAWAAYCPGQSPVNQACPCVVLCDHEAFACIGGRCTTACPPAGDAG